MAASDELGTACPNTTLWRTGAFAWPVETEGCALAVSRAAALNLRPVRPQPSRLMNKSSRSSFRSPSVRRFANVAEVADFAAEQIKSPLTGDFSAETEGFEIAPMATEPD